MRHFFMVVICLLGTGTLQSCSSEEEQMASKFDEDEFVSQIEFITWPSSAMTKGNPTIEPPKDGDGQGIISARIARKKKNCNSGFGLCDFKLFPKKKKTSTNTDIITTRSENSNKYFEIKYDSITDTYYVNMLLANQLAPNIDCGMVSLKIDEDLYWINDEETQKEIKEFMGDSTSNDYFEKGLFDAKSYKIAAGEIPYNEALGLYGGYQIKLITIQ